MAQAAMLIQQGPASEADAFRDSVTSYLAIPSLDDRVGRHAVSQLIENLPDHDAGALESGLPMADQWIGDDMFAEFQASRPAICSDLHVVVMAVSLRLACFAR